MAKRFSPSVFFFLFVFFIFSCAGTRVSNVETLVSSQNEGFWDLNPQGGDLVIIGTAGLLVNRKKALELALEDAARKAAMYGEVEGSLIREEYSGGAYYSFRIDSQTELKVDENYPSLAEELRYDPDTDVLFVEGEGIYVRVRYTPAIPLRLQYRTGGGKSRPVWIDNPPSEISGYRVGVGYAGPRMYFHDTIKASCDDAAFSIIKNYSSQVASDRIMYQGAGTFDFSNTGTSSAVSAARLGGFYVLDIWTDPSNKAVWTLAVAASAIQ
jgi:hypothetical protein